MPNESNHFRVSLFEQKHLKGFLRGEELFQFRRNPISFQPAYYSVKSTLMTREEYNNYLTNLNKIKDEN